MVEGQLYSARAIQLSNVRVRRLGFFEDVSFDPQPTDDPAQLARAAYHLGNRHVPLQIEPGRLSYQHDHVLDGLVHALAAPL